MADLGTLLQAQPVAAPEAIIFGMPMTYFIIVLVMCFTIMMLIMMFVWYWMKMGPCRGYFGAAVRGTSELGMLCRQYHQSGRASFVNPSHITGVFNTIGISLSWIQRNWESYRFGAVSMKLMCDTTGIATEPSIQQEIRNFVIWYNDYEKAKQDDDPEYLPAVITDFEDIYQMVITGRNTNGEYIPIPPNICIHIVSEVPTQNIQRFLAHVSSEDLDGHISVRISEDLLKDQKSESLPGWFWFAVAAEVVIMIVYIGMSYFQK
jgi:hypothetical protein